ncbi:MAG: DUF2142 domain-containing protein [Syntrophorhabdales bacterium]
MKIKWQDSRLAFLVAYATGLSERFAIKMIDKLMSLLMMLEGQETKSETMEQNMPRRYPFNNLMLKGGGVKCMARPEWVFTILALAVGLYMVFVTGPFQAPDEVNHFFRAYQIGEGRLLSTRVGQRVGGWLPKDVACTAVSFDDVPFHPDRRIDTALLAALLVKRPLDGGERIFVDFANTARYVPIVYLPQAAGIAIGRCFGLSVLAGTYVGRLLCLFCWMCLVWIAIRMTPVFKWVIVLVALMPMSLFLAASLSADPLINGTSILLTALVLRGAMGEGERVDLGTCIAIAGLCIILSSAKLVYAPLSALVAIIPSRRLGGHTCKAAYCGGVLAAGLAAAVLWGLETRKIYVDLYGSDATLQLMLIRTSPGTFAKALLNALSLYWWAMVKEFVGLLGWQDTRLPTWIWKTYPWALFMTAFLDSGEGRPVGTWQKAWLWGICLLGFLLIATAIYLTCTQPGAPVVEGIVGRYLIPFAVPALLLFDNRRFALKNRLPLGAALTVYSAAVLGTTCLKLYVRYYG